MRRGVRRRGGRFVSRRRVRVSRRVRKGRRFNKPSRGGGRLRIGNRF